jgi:pimeloyl-ACP methyl ester carboxylesterase
MRRSVITMGGVSLIAAAAAGAVLAALSRARRIRGFPDPVALEALLGEPSGEEVVVERPDGTRLRVRIAGAGRTVVLAHGIALTLGEWSLVSDLLLADGFRVVAFDQRGHGQSTIGTDGISAAVMAADLARLGANPTIGTLFAASFFGPRPSPAMLTAFLHMVLGHDHGPLLPLLEAFTSENLLTRLPQVDLPTVIVCGLADRTTPPRDSRRMAAAIPGARSVWVPGAGHMLPWEAPTAIRDAVASVAVRADQVR